MIDKQEISAHLTKSLKARMHSCDGMDSLVLLSDVITVVTAYMETKEREIINSVPQYPVPNKQLDEYSQSFGVHYEKDDPDHQNMPHFQDY